MGNINFEYFENLPNSGCMSLVFPIIKALGPLPKTAEKIPDIFAIYSLGGHLGHVVEVVLMSINKKIRYTLMF